MRLIAASLLMLTTALHGAALAGTGETFVSISYHDVRDDVVDDLDKDRMAVGTRNMIEQFSWLREHGYHPVSVDDILLARDGKKRLPEKAVLLTFDDGYASVYTRVFPLLKMFGYPALVAVVGEWLEAGPDEMIDYGREKAGRDKFITWEQAREMAESGLVEIASHSHGLHEGVLGNPQGNKMPAASAFAYDPETGRYETVSRQRERVGKDVKKMAALIKEKTGKAPRVMVWPYGEFNMMGYEEITSAGMEMNISLYDCVNHVDDLSSVCRILVQQNPSLDDFIWTLRNHAIKTDPVRVVHVDMDYIHDPDERQQNRNLDLLLDRIKSMRISAVYLQAFSDPDADGVADSVYFPSRHMKMRADIFNRVAWQLRTRAGVKVYAWMPVLAFALEDEKLSRELAVMEWKGGEARPSSSWYARLSPFNPRARKIIGEIYEDLAMSASFNGVLFHDDAYLNDFEDAGPDAMAAYRRWGLEGDIDGIKSGEATLNRWSRLKTEALAELTDELADRVRYYRPGVKTARNMYAAAITDKKAERWLAQSLDVFLEHYDYTAVMAMPFMEGAECPDEWLEKLAGIVSQRKDGLKRTVFELQSFDWKKKTPVPAETLKNQMRLLQRRGAVNFGYYPDDFVKGLPAFAVTKEGVSLDNYPYVRK